MKIYQNSAQQTASAQYTLVAIVVTGGVTPYCCTNVTVNSDPGKLQHKTLAQRDYYIQAEQIRQVLK